MDKNTPILHIEDDPVDVANFKRSLARCGMSNPVQVARNGDEAVATLKGVAERNRPGLIVFDLNMPVMCGLEFLELLKQDSELRVIPCIVLSASDHERDRRRAYELGAAGYIKKPFVFKEFVEATRTIFSYWMLCESP